MTVTSATRRDTTRAPRTIVVLTTARPASWAPELLKVVSIVCRMLGRKTLVVSLIALLAVGAVGYSGYRLWRHFRSLETAPPPAAAVVLTGPSAASTLPTTTPAPTPLPASVFVKVPYTAQSP